MQLKRRMGAFVGQLEWLHCSQSRNFVLHGEREQRLVGQAEAAREARRGVLTCARCASGNLIRGWGDAVPYATSARMRRRRRSSRLATMAQDA